MYELKIKFFDTVMKIVRREEAKYAAYAVDPPLVEGGLFGLATGALALPPPTSSTPIPGLNVGNALTAQPALYKTPFVQEARINDQREMLEIVVHMCGLLELSGSIDRVKVFRGVLASFPKYESCFQEWKALRQQFDEELSRCAVFYVGRVGGAFLALMEDDWAPAFAAFPSVRLEVERGLKCYAFGQHTATVFHLMRVAEQGLRAVAKERKVRLPKDRPIEETDWGTLATRLRTQVERVNNWPAKKASKKAALGYYNGVLADILFFKDGYRNIVSHSLTTFDEAEATKAVTRVCDFMKTVSSRTDETGKRIVWK